ncbi:DEAD/DEAH box helicase [Lactococcus lactis]|uniref:DEAD/DEAH box helicase n=1 Tax=Lactococcus lactis TaxID=1358 RepID=UPI003D16E7F3
MTAFNKEYILDKNELSDFSESFDIAKYASSIIDEKDGREIVIHILDIWDNVNENTREIWLDLIERAGFYPYFKDKQATIDYKGSTQGQIRSSFFKSDYLPKIYFHERQKEIEMLISEGQNLAVSAPTSFGKSLLIEEIVARNKFANILIIQPTLALIDETRQKLKKYSDYNLIVNTRQTPKEKNIFILTAERVLEFPNLPQIDFFIIDEFYKVSKRRDNRTEPLNVALYKILNTNPQALFLTPTVDNLSEKFREKYNIKFFKTDYQLVNTNFKEIRTANNNKKNEELYGLLETLSEPTIVYVKHPSDAYKFANGYLEYLSAKDSLPTQRALDIFPWINDNISSDWRLKKFLSYGIGIHCGPIPRHIAISEVEYFNSEQNDSNRIDVLFATTSLIEGVNTSAKNIVIFSKLKGQKIPIDYFDFANISGRAGRMGKHFTGDVYLFEEKPPKEDFVIDVPISDQRNISDEIIVNLDREDIEEKDRFDELQEDDEELNILIKKNLVNVKGQKEIINYIKAHLKSCQEFLVWNDTRPTYDQLRKTLWLGYKSLHMDGEPTSEGFANRQALLSQKLAYGTLKDAIQTAYQRLLDNNNNKTKTNESLLNKAITDMLKFQRNDAAFRIPKLLDVVGSLQRYVFTKHNLPYGDYSTFSALLENERLQPNLQFLVDFGVPASAIIKIQQYISSDVPESDVMKYIIGQINNPSLLEYERKLLIRAVN